NPGEAAPARLGGSGDSHVEPFARGGGPPVLEAAARDHSGEALHADVAPIGRRPFSVRQGISEGSPARVLIRGVTSPVVERRNVPTPAWWKEFYAREREGLDLDALIDAAPEIAFPDRGALVFPHTRLTVTGTMVAAVARAAARARREVLAVGVLHGVRGPRGIPEETGLARDEFSLDGFRALYGRVCAREGIPARFLARYPLEVGDRVDDLPGLDELRRRAESSLVVATADPIHHGVGYE